MRKLFSVFLIAVLLISGAGCAASGKDTVFFYPREEILYGQADGVIASETRDVSGREEDLRYLLTLYLEGPISQELYSPFPKGTAIVQLENHGDTLSVTLSDAFSQLEGLDYTIACASIARTCFALGDYEAVEIASEGRTITLNPDTVALVDTVAATDPT